MKLSLATAFAVITLGFAGSAFADGLAATLETPQTTRARFNAMNGVWKCEGSACVGALEPGSSDSVLQCRALARKVGRVTAYGTDRPLDEKHLAKCNEAAAGPGPIGTASR